MEEIQKVYYKINEVADSVHTLTSTIRFWEDKFSDYIGKVKRTKSGHRLYNQSQLLRFQRIHKLLKIDGMTIKGALKRINR